MRFCDGHYPAITEIQPLLDLSHRAFGDRPTMARRALGNMSIPLFAAVDESDVSTNVAGTCDP